MTALKLLDVVAITEDFPGQSLLRGQVGTVVELLAPEVFEVEFCDEAGRTYMSKALNITGVLYDQMLLVPPEAVRILSPAELRSLGLNINDPNWDDAKAAREAKEIGITRVETVARKACASTICPQYVRPGKFFDDDLICQANVLRFSMLCTKQYSFHCPSTFLRPRNVNRSRRLLWRRFPRPYYTITDLHCQAPFDRIKSPRPDASGGGV